MLRKTMVIARSRSRRAPRALLALALVAFTVDRGRASEPADPLAAEIARWSAFLRNNPASDEMWTQVKEGSQPALVRAEEALRDGRRLLALLRLASPRPNLSASAYLGERSPEQRKDPAAFEAEWTRMGRLLRDDLGAPSPAALDGVRPSAVRALGEAALPQVRIYYEASLEYGRNTMPDAGLFYIGAAQAQREFTAFCRTLSRPKTREAPPARALDVELDALAADLLAAYRPPASIDRHPEFIVASATLKEARELDALGLRYGALLRYLQASLRFAPLRPSPGPIEAAALASRLRELDRRLSASGIDDSLGRLFLEVAQADVAAAKPGETPAAAATIASDVLPRYFAALEPARPAAPRPAPRATVTLVRWPYT
jgi:hypothetical protein